MITWTIDEAAQGVSTSTHSSKHQGFISLVCDRLDILFSPTQQYTREAISAEKKFVEESLHCYRMWTFPLSSSSSPWRKIDHLASSISHRHLQPNNNTASLPSLCSLAIIIGGRSCLNLHESPIVNSVISLSSPIVSAKNVVMIFFCGRPSSSCWRREERVKRCSLQGMFPCRRRWGERGHVPNSRPSLRTASKSFKLERKAIVWTNRNRARVSQEGAVTV